MVIIHLKLMFCFIGLLLTGCASFGDLERGLNALVDEDIDTAVSVLGYPDSKMDFKGQNIYIWSASRVGTVIMPSTAYTTGYVGMTPYTAQTNYNQVSSYQANCMLKISCDSSDRITTWQYEGSVSGCYDFINRLTAFANQKADISNRTCEVECDDLYRQGKLRSGATAETCKQTVCG